MALTEGSDRLASWLNPPVQAHLEGDKCYMFALRASIHIVLLAHLFMIPMFQDTGFMLRILMR